MENETHATTSSGPASKKRKDEKNRRRDQRAWENIMKCLSNLPEPVKISTIQEKYNEIYTELRTASNTLYLMEKQYSMLQREKDHLQTDLTKNILAKSKLEDLCRELQKQNKIIKDENITRVKEEEERRREVATNFTEKLNTLTALMDENKDKSALLREENISMTAKLTELYDQFQEREALLANMNHQMELQKKVSEAQLKKREIEFETDRQLWQKEREIMLSNLEKSDTANRVLQENVQGLQNHVDVYKNHYADFENTMQKSNKVFAAIREEVTTMQKTKAVLEKERNDYYSRWQSCTQSLLQLSEVYEQTKTELQMLQKKVDMLEKLCRQLQTDRSTYIQQLKENDIVPIAPNKDRRDENSNAGPSTGRKQTDSEKIITGVQLGILALEKKIIDVAPAVDLSEDRIIVKQNMDPRKVNEQEQEVHEISSDSSIDSSEAVNAPGSGEAPSRPGTALSIRSSVSSRSGTAPPSPGVVPPSPGAAVARECSSPIQFGNYKGDTSFGLLNTSSESEVDLDLIRPTRFDSTETVIDESNINLADAASTSTIPLYPAEALTDIPAQAAQELYENFGTSALVGRPSTADTAISLGDEEGSVGDVSSQSTIPLREAEGQTDMKKE